MPKILAVFTLVSMVVVLLWYRGRAAPGSDGGGVKLPKEVRLCYVRLGSRTCS